VERSSTARMAPTKVWQWGYPTTWSDLRNGMAADELR